MTDYQPIDYRLRCHTKRTDLPADVLRDIGEAYAEIERLRKELDELRRLYCNTMSSVTQTYAERSRKKPNQVATEMGWNCFGENTNA